MTLADRDKRRFILEDDPLGGKGPRGQVLDAVERSNFTVEYLHEPVRYLSATELMRGDSFGIFLRPQTRARQLYGLDREILLWCSTYPSFQARDIEALRGVLDDTGTRLSRQFVVLATRYDPGTRNALESEASLDQTLVHISLDQLRERGLDSLLAEHLYSRDLFDVAGATVRAADFFGRRDLIDRLVSEIEVGTSQVGVFGLRKVGKTSLLNRVADKLTSARNVSVARLDLQWSTSINPRPEYTLWALGEALRASHRSVRSTRGFRLIGQYSAFSDIAQPSVVWELFAHDLKLLLDSTRRRYCFLFDEVERIYERSDGDFVRFWRLLRGLDQQNPGRLRYVVGGTSPECAELGSIGKEDNPLFNYLQLEYLGPLQDADADKLLETLGSTMGLNFQTAAREWMRAESGGHPALLRALGSSVHQANSKRREPVTVDLARVQELQTRLAQRAAPILDQMISALEDQYKVEYELLESLAQGRLFHFNEYSEAFPSEVQRLRRYGLITGGEPPTIRIRELHTHVLRRLSAQQFGNYARGSGQLDAETPLGEWRVARCLASGGYADVYEVVSQGGELAAAKVLKSGQLSALQREVEALKELRHRNIVEFGESMRAPDGKPCLIMEFLPGRNAASYCTPSSAPSLDVLRRWLLSLLDALEFMHPKAGAVKRLEAQEFLSSTEFAEWGRARHGYIHRDIKPENIMIVPGRGPVLIDFNIAVRAGAPVVTTSATSGYLPFIPATWMPEFDLYALGVTFYELGAGLRVSSCSVEELRSIAVSRHGESAARIGELLIGAVEVRSSAKAVRTELASFPRIQPG